MHQSSWSQFFGWENPISSLLASRNYLPPSLKSLTDKNWLTWKIKQNKLLYEPYSSIT